MKYLKPLILTLLALIIATYATSAQTFDNINVADASTVCSIAQDSQGIMWLGTERGLYSYDGYRTIPHNTAADGSSLATRIHSMLIFHNIIYMGTERGLFVYDILKGRYADTDGRQSRDIRAVALHGGRLWLGGAQGLFSLNLANGNVRVENRHIQNVYSLLGTRNGLLIGTMGGLALRSDNGNTRQITICSGNQPLVNAMLAESGSSVVWIGTEGALYRYDWHRLECIAPLNGNSIKSLDMQGGNIYAGTDNGLFIYNKVTHVVNHALHDSRSPQSIANNIVWSVAADRWDNIWAGTDQGVSVIGRHQFYKYIPLSDITQTGDGNCLHLIYRSDNNMLWLGGTNGLIGYKTAHGFMPDKAGNVDWYRQTSTTRYMSHNRVRRVYTDLDGTVIVCTDHGLNIYNPQTRQMRNVIVTDRSHRYNTTWAYDIVDDGMGRYWICSYMGGVFVIAKEKLLHAANGTAIADRHVLKELQGIHVWQLVKDGKGHIWARMYDRGLDRIDSRTMHVDHVIGKDRIVNDLTTDSQGNVWAAMDGEIHCFGTTATTDRSLRMAAYDVNDAALLCCVGNDVWAVSGGDCCIIGKNGQSTRFAVPGFRPLAISYDHVSRCVLLGGNDAVVSIPVDGVTRSYLNADYRGVARHSSAARHNFLLSGIMVDGKPLVTEDGYPTYLSEITLSARQNNVTFQLTDLPMSGQMPYVYAYRLDGIDRSWKYMHGERQEISYNALPPGNYNLEVRLVDGLGEAKGEVFKLGLTILPPWYMSVWAKLVYLVLFVALIVWTINFYWIRRRLREEHEAKERIIEESTARSAFFDNLSRQLRQPLGATFGAILNMLHKEQNSSNIRSLEQMRRNVVGINSLVFKVLDLQQTKNDNGQVAKVMFDIVDFCRRTAEDARARNGKTVEIDYTTDIPEVLVSLDVVRLQPVLDELVDFAVCNRDSDGHVKITVAADDNSVSVLVGIPGLEIPKAEMPFVFNRYHSVGVNSLNAETNVLALTHEFTEMNGAQTLIENNDDGTTVAMVFDVIPATTTVKRSSEGRTVNINLPDTDSADARMLAKITETVEKFIADSDFNVTRLQETLGLGSKLLYRKVKQMTGKTPIEFIRHIRMQRAAVLLREGRFSVSEVMYMVGFSNSSYFSKIFQKTYGITPAEFSKKSR